jgi:hypothetical protein
MRTLERFRELARDWAEGSRCSVALSEEMAAATRAMAAAAIARADQVNARYRDVMGHEDAADAADWEAAA